ncbi:hypothetical protein LSG31_19175 [Fodinisporobacter ferrooxydans]|uniref:DUF4829 domain-containing protein n=1 Tax=Fodinisporobacter ferrooxydans TaxID=2901836 RepID=A0ABY4CHY4_9BACL|nr:hypothetical protein LSG31_19175 [Alicyclobacillaceae bacterium MYW30-H2]
MKASNAFVKILLTAVMVIGIVAVILLQVLQDPVRKQNDPLVVTENFVHYIELGQYDKANQLSAPTLQNQPQWINALRQLNLSLEPNAVMFKNLGQTGTQAKIQFYSQPAYVLSLTNDNGKWYVAGPSAQ